MSRIDRDARREYLAVFNAGEAPARVTVQTATPSAAWDALLGSATGATSGADGRVSVTVPPLTAILLRAGADLPKRSVAKATLKIRPDEISSLLRVSATASTLDPLAVTFAVRRAGQKRVEQARRRRLGAVRRRTSTRAGTARASASPS